MEQKRVFSLLVDNTSSVLSRVSGLFTRRGYNIHSISAGVTMDPRFTRITVVVDGDDLIFEQIEKQMRKMVDVIDVKTLKEGVSVCRELIMIKIRASAEERQAIFLGLTQCSLQIRRKEREVKFNDMKKNRTKQMSLRKRWYRWMILKST